MMKTMRELVVKCSKCEQSIKMKLTDEILGEFGGEKLEIFLVTNVEYICPRCSSKQI